MVTDIHGFVQTQDPSRILKSRSTVKLKKKFKGTNQEYFKDMFDEHLNNKLPVIESSRKQEKRERMKHDIKITEQH
jgi:hypothetical protein